MSRSSTPAASTPTPAMKSSMTSSHMTSSQNNGYFSPPSSPSIRFGGSTRGSTRMISSSYSLLQGSSHRNSQKSSLVRDTAIALKRKSASELGAGISETADNVSFVGLVEYIRAERLQTLPHKGSRWDTVLIRALYFAERLHGFELGLKSHASETELAANLGYGHIRLLLDLGNGNSDALEKAFGFMYRCSSSVSALLARSQVLSLSPEVYQQLCMMYTDLLTLVIDVAVRFYRTVHGSDESSSSLNMYDVFGDTIATFRERREAITRAIWKDQIDADDSIEEDADVSSISRWLEPQDRVLATLALDHTLIADELAEFTCVWFLDDLAKFIKSENASFLVNGDAGAGKTTLAASLAERFQRPIGRKAYTTAFCSVGAVPSQATSLNVVKALMHSILNIRVGNMHLYHAVVQAYETARYEPDPTKYEDLLWQAFELALRSPLENAPHLVLIVEGLDELIGGQSAGQALLQRLVRAVEQGKGVKLVALAQNLKLPTGARGVQQSITVEDTRSDMHQVILKTLVKSAHFRGTTGREQETNVKRIIDIADGSFLWASLTAEVLRMEKSGEDYNKAIGNLEKPKASIEDLVQTLLSRLQPTDDAKLLLSWLVNAARPLTYHEIEALYTLNVQQGTRVDRGVDVHSIVQTLAPLIDVQEDIVRPRHNLVHNAIRSLLKQGKVTMPIKDQAFDLLLRLLTYAKLSLPDKGEPTLDASDRSIIDHHFNRHIFLEYVIRYWTWHLQQASVCTLSKPDEIKMTPELQKVFPDSTIMPILEWLCWDDQFPGAQEVEYHDLVGHLRAKVLTEKHPAVLQSSINTACYYEMMEDWPTASARYYSISTIGRTILSVSHPIVVETASRFLRISETRVTKTRTEVVTQREQVLLLLIAAYERQYGPNHDIVVRTREQLADLYIHIGENDKATEVLQIIHGHVQDNYRNGETSTRANDEHLRIKFGKSRDRGDLKEYENGIFTGEDEEEESLVIREIEQVDVILRQIEQYISQKDYVRAEQTYIELWQRLSETCRTTLSVDWHQKKIQVVQSYAKFLETNKRRTEATSIITATWKEYENHELSFSEKIVSSLTECARFLKNVGEYTAALSIFKHASYYYRNIKKEESKSLMEIEEEMIQTTTQAFSRTTKDETTKTSTSESTHYEMFHVLISNKSKAIDQSTMTLAHTLTNKYIEQRSWAEAISVVQETLARTWSSFLSKSVHEVTMTETFRQESIELVEKLAIIYREQRIWEKVEDVYVRLFRAALTNPKDQALLEKARTHLVDFYTKRGRPGKVIQIYQELLAVYRRTLGPSHDTTVTILYQLGSLCRLHARSHPYWIEYYQQICNSLNNDSATIHTRAFDAAVIVAESYWEECRYSDAVVAYAIIWNTFVQKNKEFKTFTDVAFVQNLYERYYQSLEESKSDFDVLKIVTSQYRDTTKTIFGANSLIYVEATVALARVTQRSDSHQDDSIALFEEAFQSSRKDAALSKSLQIDQGEFRQTLTTMYKKRIFHSSNAASPETMAKAISIYETQVSEKKSKYGYSHEETLTSLRELAQLYVRQQKTDLAVKELQNAVVEIVQKETSSQRAYESAIAIVQTYQAANLTQQLVQLTEELHYQLIVREKRQSSTFSVVESSSVSLFFLATIQYQIRKDLSLTLSDTMASLTSEYIMYQNFKQLVKNKAALDKLLLAAAPLRQHLRFWNRTALVGAVDHECVQIFVQREASSVQLLSKDSPRHFIIGIMDYIGNRKHVEFVRAVIIASNGTLKKLIDNNQFQDAHDIAKMTFMYAQHRNGYRGPKGISRGFELASYLDGRGENKCPDPELRKKMLQLSNKIVKDIIVICREQQINFAQVPLKELNELIALLGEQGDYDTLEVLLNELWNTREAQKNWPGKVLLNLGRRLISARYLAGHQIKALRLCEDIAYNLRRVNGNRHPDTLEAYGMLAELYTSLGQAYQKQTGDKAAPGMAADHFKKAVVVHEEVLRWLLADATGGDGMDAEDDDDDTAASILAEHGIQSTTHGQFGGGEEEHAAFNETRRAELVRTHIRLLKLAYQRLGSWPKQYAVYEKLNADLFRSFGEELRGFEGVEKWTAKGFGGGKAESNEGAFQTSRSWEIIVSTSPKVVVEQKAQLSPKPEAPVTPVTPVTPAKAKSIRG